MIVFGCCFGDWGKVERNIRPHVPAGAEMCFLGGQTSIASAYNRIIEYCVKHPEPVEALVLLHDDLELVDLDAESLIRFAAQDWDVAGVIGAEETPTGLAWWNHRLTGWQNTDSGTVGPSARCGPARAVDGSIMILSPWAIDNIRFDPAYPGFHGYDVDYCRQVIEGFGKVGVVPIATHHHSTLGWKSADILASWQEADRIYRAKWGHE